jgi:uncharacterized membrane protein YgcG
MDGIFGFVVVGAVMAYLIVVRPLLRFVRNRATPAESAEQAQARSEALFRATFPDLQPHFHPARVAEYVLARVGGKAAPVAGVIERPPGFGAAARARVSAAPKGERTVLEDAAGARLADFTLERKEGAVGALRLGAGKFTVRRGDAGVLSVKYWHPDREFVWSPPATWKFTTRLADEPIDSSDRGTSWSSSSDSSSPAAAAAAFVGGGGTFDGGGASAGWDADSGRESHAGSASAATGGASSVHDGGSEAGSSGAGDAGSSDDGAGSDSSGGDGDSSTSTSY